MLSLKILVKNLSYNYTVLSFLKLYGHMALRAPNVNWPKHFGFFPANVLDILRFQIVFVPKYFDDLFSM